MKLVPIIRHIGDHHEQHHFIKRLDVQAQELLGLVGRVLSFNDVSAGGQGLDLVEHDSDAIFSQLFESHAQKAALRKQELSIVYEVTTSTLHVVTRRRSSRHWISFWITALSLVWRAVGLSA